MAIIRAERVVISLAFALAGFSKVLGLAFEMDAFARWGFPSGFMYFIGVLEIAGAAGIWLRRLSPFVALCLSALALGALVTRVIFFEWVAALVTALLLLICLHYTWLKRDELFPH